MIQRDLEQHLEQLRALSLYRSLREIASPQGTTLQIAGRQLLNFSSNDYLGLANDSRLKEAAKNAIDSFGLGAGASRLVCGNLSAHSSLEQKLAVFKRTEAALVFSSGYATALGTISALAGQQDVIILDKLAHACLIDGARLSGATLRVFPHNHVGKLESHLQWARTTHPTARVLVITESVFSMDGDCAPLAEIVELKDRYGATLLLDEAHAVGVLGECGRGLADSCGLAERIDIQMGTLSKGLGASGGYVCGSRTLIDLLVNSARSFIFSTAPSPAVAAAAEAAIDFLLSPEGAKRIAMLWNNLAILSRELPEGCAQNISSAIVPLIIGTEDKALHAAKELQDQGLLVPAIRYPTVAKGKARLRLTLSALHTNEQISLLCRALSGLAPLGARG